MVNRTVLCLMAAFALVMLLGCSSKNQGDLVGPASHGTSSFKLTVLDDTYFNGGSAGDYSLETTDYGEEVVVDIKVQDAQNMKALFATLEYDPDVYRPLICEPAANAGERDDLLVLNVLRDAGVVHYNHILKNPGWRTGFSGDGLLAQVSFKKEPMVDLRTVSTPPTANASTTTVSWDAGTNTLSWGYYSQGDYDQNSEVAGADIVPLSQHYLEHGTFDVNSIQAVIDGDSNTELNQADIVPIAQNYLFSSIGGYNIYHSTTAADYPDGGERLANVAFTAATGNKNTQRLQFSYEVTAPIANDYYWVRPSDNSTDGISSNLVGGNPAEQPHLELTNPPAVGSGASDDRYRMDVAVDYVFTLTDQAGPTDVSVDANTIWTVNPASAGSVVKGATAVLNIEDAFEGDFSVSATYDGQPSNPNAIYCHVTGGGGGDLEIYPDPADSDWPATGSGTEADPYVLPTDYVTDYSLLADDTVGAGGNGIAVGDLTWSAFPPFIVTWTTDGTFRATLFTGNYIFAQNSSMENSNNLYVEVHNLPAS